ncbi:cytochrome P450 [Streptomyces incarnatus]|uniref:Cytochrome P450 n=1 Tax=Streptomyces incarnatus TaxID=665007 RepID=A0ABM5TW45_9ACTN|nr:cytochrome P450 [Streptomyces incarnatus]AKJ15224.1 cytochrome P450 [Streptomyces incarnatus]
MTVAPSPSPSPSGARAARRRDRRVYTRSHPVLFALLAATRRRPVTRIGGTLLVHGSDAYRHALTGVPLDRTAAGTTGGAAREMSVGGLLFDQEGTGHRDTRRALAGGLGAAGVERLRAVWREVLARRLAPLGAGATVDLVPLAQELAGVTVCALLGAGADPGCVAEAAARAAATAVRDHLPGPRLPGTTRKSAAATHRLQTLLDPTRPATATSKADPGHGTPGEAPGTPREPTSTPGKGPSTPTAAPDAPGARGSAPSMSGDGDQSALWAMLAVAAVNTTVAALPRAAAWCADAALWDQAADDRLRPLLVDELLRVIAPSPLLPRAAAADARLDGCPVRAGDRLILVARHAARAHTDPPNARHPAPAADAQLVFGAGPHACPGARLARAQLDDTLAALAAHRPAVVRARVDRGAALPSWRSLTVRATVTSRPED